MSETEFFRILKAKHTDYAFFAARNADAIAKPYSVTLRIGLDLFHGRGATLPEAMHEAGHAAGLDFRDKPRDARAADPAWPQG